MEISYLNASIIMLVIVVVVAVLFVGIPFLKREKVATGNFRAAAPAGGRHHPPRETFGGSRKERYGEPPGFRRAVHHDELGFRGWADMPGDYEGSSASAVSAYMMRSA
jgi:hypothetical protein